MNNDLISVVLPIYNVEKYLERCITSVVNQTYRNLEIILVDDGSPDGCPEICDAWAKKDSRIRVIHKKNAGLGMARNTGIDHATGKYICFFDSDDYIALNTIEQAYREIKKQQAQIVCFGFHAVDPSGRIVRTLVPACPKNTFSGREVQDEFLPNLLFQSSHAKEHWRLNASAWMCMFSMDLIHQIAWRFVSERRIISEDIYSLLVLFEHVDRLAVLAEALYFYCENASSLTRTFRADRFERIVDFYHESAKVCCAAGYSETVQLRLACAMYSNTIGAMKQIAHSRESIPQKHSALRQILAHEIWRSAFMKDVYHYETGRRKLLLGCILHRQTVMCFLLCWLNRR